MAKVRLLPSGKGAHSSKAIKPPNTHPSLTPEALFASFLLGAP